MTTPRLGAPELVQAQAIPETTVNEIARILEQGAGWFVFKDRDLTAPPGSPADGDCYLVAASATGAWAGHDGEIAYRMNTAWEFIEPVEGMGAGVQDENAAIAFLGGSWVTLATGGGYTDAQARIATQEWAPNFTAAGDVYIPAVDAMTIGQGNAAIGTGTLAFAKSTTAAPGTFSATTLPATLQAGAWLKVTASAVTGFVATHLRRTA